MDQLRGNSRGIVGVRAEATQDATVKQTIAELNKAFAAFRETNDKHLEGKADADAVEKVNAAVGDLQRKLEEQMSAAAARTDELEAQMSRIPAGGEGGAKPEEVRAQAVQFHAGRTAQTEVQLDDTQVEAYSKYAEVFAETFLRRGDKKAAVQAAMEVGSDPDGGYWVPTQMVNDVKRRIFETSPVRQVASVITITTDSVTFPTDTNDATSGGWVGETDSRSDTATPQVGEQTIYVREQYAQPKVTQKLLDMATIDVEDWLSGKIADKLARVENTAFVSGTGVTQPRGFLDYRGAAVTTADASRAWGVLQYIPLGADGAFPDASGIAGAKDPDALIDTIAALKPEYRGGAIWAMNRATEAAVRKLKDADGRYLVGMGDIRDGVRGFELFGYPIVTMEDMPNLGSDSFSIAFGNFAMGYQIVDGRGLRVLRDPLTDKPYVKFYTTKWTGGDVVNFDAIKLVKAAAS
jgi:HK97 family phage major capsid protein